MDVAHLPDVQNKSSELTKRELLQLRIATLLAEGQTIGQVAKVMANGDQSKVRLWRDRIRRWSYTDQAFQAACVMVNRGEMFTGLPAAGRATSRRARRGRTDAHKLMLEVTGAYNPRVKHDHSGEVSLVVRHIPRADPEPEPDVVDADVVEE